MTNTFRYSVPTLLGTRGAGFGNEVISWGKAFIGAQELGLRTLHPAWALNPRGYRHDFGTSILDWAAHRALRGIPSINVSVDLATSRDDYADVMRDISERVDRKQGPLAVFHSSGMSGGYYGIRGARTFLRSAVTTPVHVSRDMYKVEQRLSPQRLTVALHIRAGDFGANTEGPQPGQFNTMLPISWYASVGKNLRAAFGGSVEFVILTDDEEDPSIVSLSGDLEAISLPQRSRPLLSDIAMMASADLLVCSVSSLSMFAAFISEKPYVWYGPHLGERGGLRSIWGHEPHQIEGRTASNARNFTEDQLLTRGTGAMEDGALSTGLLAHLDNVLAIKNQSRDLLMYGVVR